MATDNETFEEAIVAARKMIHDRPAIRGGLGEFRYQLKANSELDRIEAAHKREIATKDAEITRLRTLVKETTDKLASISERGQGRKGKECI